MLTLSLLLVLSGTLNKKLKKKTKLKDKKNADAFTLVCFRRNSRTLDIKTFCKTFSMMGFNKRNVLRNVFF